MPIPNTGPSSPLFQFQGHDGAPGQEEQASRAPEAGAKRSMLQMPSKHLAIRKLGGGHKGTLKGPGQPHLLPQGHLRTCWCRA